MTDSLKVTVQLTVDEFVGEPSTRLIDETVGAVASTITLPASVKVELAPVVQPLLE